MTPLVGVRSICLHSLQNNHAYTGATRRQSLPDHWRGLRDRAGTGYPTFFDLEKRHCQSHQRPSPSISTVIGSTSVMPMVSHAVPRACSSSLFVLREGDTMGQMGQMGLMGQRSPMSPMSLRSLRSPMGQRSPMSPMGPMGQRSPMGLMGLMSLM